MKEGLFAQMESNNEKAINEAGLKLMGELNRDSVLNQWGSEMGDPNPWLADYKPAKKSRSEKEEAERLRLEMEKNKKNREQVKKNIRDFFESWKFAKSVDNETALKVWESMAGVLQDRGWPGMKDAILEALYDIGEERAA